MFLPAVIEDALLNLLARKPGEQESGKTTQYTIDNCLYFARKTIPDFDSYIVGRSVLDHGCGPGWQAVAMRVQSGAASVYGLEIESHWHEQGRELARSYSCEDSVSFGSSVPKDARFDVVVSLGAFEHYADPAAELGRMASLLKPGGVILLSWSEPWYYHSGSHIACFTRIPGTNQPVPWANLIFSERALLKLRSRFRSDQASRYSEIAGGLNQMTLARFEQILDESALDVERVYYLAMRGLPLVTRIPVIRELFTFSASCILRVPATASAPSLQLHRQSYASQR